MANEEKPTASKVLVLAGGGIDSTACVHQLLTLGLEVRMLHVDFGQVAATHEWKAVQSVAKFFRVAMDQIVVKASQFGGGEIVGRNAFLLTLALVYRQPKEHLICIGVHSGTPFYDCSEAFFNEVSALVANLTGGAVRLMAPLIKLQKSEIVKYCVENQVPLALTYSCQSGQQFGCGVCLSCLDRKALGC